jgi:hypothetical protein
MALVESHRRMITRVDAMSASSRSRIHDQFVARFHVGDPPRPLTEQQLDGIETELNTKRPIAFREFMVRHGPVHTPTILDALTDQRILYPDVQEFLTSDEAIDGTKGYWSAGMPANIIGIASDCMGNMIGFYRQTDVLDDAPVVFFDHDFLDVSEITDSFDEFLEWYLKHLNGR